jgi:hypothetical protein
VRSGLAARVAAFRSDTPVEDLARLSERSGVQLTLLAVSPGHLRDLESLASLLREVACDVALLARADCLPGPGPVVIAFGGGDNDWAALELGLSLAEAHGTDLVIAGGSRSGRDASRALAAASLAVQRVSDLVARPLILPAGPDAIAQAAKGARALLLGLPDDWRRRGLGDARAALTESSPAPTLVVRRGLRIGSLTPDDRVTRFTWSA